MFATEKSAQVARAASARAALTWIKDGGLHFACATIRNEDQTLSAARHGEQSAFERIGGRDGLGRLAKRFYEIMAQRPDAAGIRAMHRADLGPITESLTDFLMSWIGGPRDWFMRPGRPCIMSLHRALPIGESERDQWLACMKQALDETVSDVDLREELGPAFFRIADAMRSS